jgi:hypothetical protein
MFRNQVFLFVLFLLDHIWNLCSQLLLIDLRCFCHHAETNFCLLPLIYICHYFWAVRLLTADRTAVRLDAGTLPANSVTGVMRILCY